MLYHSVVEPSVHRRPVPVVPLARQNAQVSPAERRVAQGVAHGVDCTVDVA